MDCVIVLLNTVAENHEGFTRWEYEGAKVERCSLGLMVYSSEQDFAIMVSSNMITNYPITYCKIQNANKIFGPGVPTMKGKSVSRRSEAVVSYYMGIPEEILAMNTDLEVSVDVMFVKKFPFLVSVMKRLKFMTIKYIANRMEKKLAKSINKIVYLYLK